VTSDRRLGWIVLVAGATLALAVQLAAPVAVPLFDGVAVQEPYRYLHPTANQAGSPTSYSAAPAIDGGVSPAFIAATTESQPQAQLIAQRGAFEVPAGATTLDVSITPIEPPPAPEEWSIAGNVYRISVTDQARNPMAIKSCEGCISLTLRAPDGVEGGTIKRFANGAWTDVQTMHVGTVAMYQANPTALGDYAVVTVPDSGPGPIVIVGGTILAGLLLVGLFIYLRMRRARAQAALVDRRRRPGTSQIPSRVPSKRRAPRRPPSGRSDK
jgi:hypothetical protein